jgi:hypothetical protein
MEIVSAPLQNDYLFENLKFDAFPRSHPVLDGVLF